MEGKRSGWGGKGEGMKERRKSRERRKRSGGNRVEKKRKKGAWETTYSQLEKKRSVCNG